MERAMKAIVQDGYGEPAEVLRLAETDRPRIGAHDVRVRVRAASVHPDIWHVVTGRPYVLRLMGSGLFRPKAKIPGLTAVIDRTFPLDETVQAMRYMQEGRALGRFVLSP